MLVRIRRNYRSLSGIVVFLVVLAGLSVGLAGCGLGSGGSHGPGRITFQGKLSLLRVPDPYTLPGQIILGPDGNLWFPAVAYPNFATSKTSGAIGRLTPDGQFRFFPLTSPNSYPTDITFGRDGAVWFTLFQGNGVLAPNVDTAPHFTDGFWEIGQMTADGRFSFFSLPTPEADLHGIATGPDGAVWFTESLVNGNGTSWIQKIGRMTTAGTIKEFANLSLPATDNLGALIAGADGNLWFAVESYNPANYYTIGKMGRISPQGSVKIFSLGTSDPPRDLTIGPDNNIWFSTDQSIGSMTNDGHLRLFTPHTNPGDSIGIGGITSGSDGALWFATDHIEVGRLTTDGAFTFYPFPANTYFDNGNSSLTLGELKGIVKGADGTLWLTDDGQIGHYV